MTDMISDERVVLVDERDREMGTALKAEVHTDKTPLHRAFSIFLFDKDGNILVTQRALSKKTWPGIWSNSCCGHPAPGESYEAAISRRVRQELGIRVEHIEKVNDYRYQFTKDGVMENEVCPVYRGVGVGVIRPNVEEVEDWKWMEWKEFLGTLNEDTRLHQDSGPLRRSVSEASEAKWSPWVKEEVRLFTA